MSTRLLKISDKLSLPLDAVTQTFAILGIRGSGKTNTGVVLMEELLKHDQQCVVLDPTNAWYGIRSSRDGRSHGYQVYVFGGANGDLPLEGTHGPIMADFVVETGASVVFSLRHLSMNDQRSFAMGFGERLHQLKGRAEYRSPLCLFLDEADEFIPQRIPHGYERMFGAYDRLVRRDRNVGLGVVLISQRPQVLNKDTLSQIETLICHRLLHKLDRKSVKESWVEGHDIYGKADEFFGSLASLSRGDAWVWSPEWMDIFKRIHIRQRETFDSSSTPKAGQAAKVAKQLAPVDLDLLKEKLSHTIEKARQDDPRELRSEIQRLKKELSTHRPAAPPISKPVEKIVEKRVEVKIPSIPRSAFRYLEKLTRLAEEITGVTESMGDDMRALNQVQPRQTTAPAHATRPVSPPSTAPAPAPKQSTPHTNGSAKLRAGAERMLTSLAQWSPNGMPLGQMRSHAGLKKSGTLKAYLSDLRTGGYIEFRDGLFFATDRGLQYFGGNLPPSPRSTEDVLAVWEPKLREGARRMLRVVIENGGAPMTIDELAERAALVKSGTLKAYLSDLRTARLITTEHGTVAANKETLFL